MTKIGSSVLGKKPRFSDYAEDRLRRPERKMYENILTALMTLYPGYVGKVSFTYSAKYQRPVILVHPDVKAPVSGAIEQIIFNEAEKFGYRVEADERPDGSGEYMFYD